MSEDTKVTSYVSQVTAIPEFAEAIAQCEQVMVDADASVCSVTEQKGGLGHAVVACNDSIKQAWVDYQSRMESEGLSVEYYLEDISAFEMEAELRVHDAKKKLEGIVGALDSYDIGLEHGGLFRDYATNYAKGVFAKGQACSEAPPVGFSENYQAANCTNLNSVVNSIEDSAAIIGCEPPGTSVKDLWTKYGEVTVFGGGRQQGEDRNLFDLGAGKFQES